MAYQSLYRKYRSQTFGDLVGQDHVVRTLRNAIASGRIAQTYLFTGPRGTGKTSTARLLAKALCAENGPTPDPSDDDPICRAIAEGNFMDVVEIDAASESGVEQVRTSIIDTVEYRPMIARYKVFIIDEVHDLSAKAFDALLKTIEEPPPHLIFILATTEFNRVPPTIRSRCQKFEFHRASMTDLVARLTYVAGAEGVEAEAAALTAIARMADGGYRDALTLLEQAILTGEGRVTLAQVYDQLGLVPDEITDGLLEAIRGGDVPGVMARLGEVAHRGRDPRALMDSLMHRLGDLTRASYGVEAGGMDPARDASLIELASRLGREFVLRLRGQVADAHRALRDITLPRLWLEAEMIRLATLPTPGAPPVAAPAASPRPTADAPARPGSRRMPGEGSSEVGVRDSGNGERGTGNGERNEPPPATPNQRTNEPTLSPEPNRPTAQPPTEPPNHRTTEIPEPPNHRTNEPTPLPTAWPAIVVALSGLSKALAMKIEGSRAFEEGGKAVVELTRASYLDWFDGKPKAFHAIQDEIRKATGRPYDLDLRARKEGAPKFDEPETTVELPLEGEALLKRLDELFNGSAPTPPEAE